MRGKKIQRGGKWWGVVWAFFLMGLGWLAEWKRSGMEAKGRVRWEGGEAERLRRLLSRLRGVTVWASEKLPSNDL